MNGYATVYWASEVPDSGPLDYSVPSEPTSDGEQSLYCYSPLVQQ